MSENSYLTEFWLAKAIRTLGFTFEDVEEYYVEDLTLSMEIVDVEHQGSGKKYKTLYVGVQLDTGDGNVFDPEHKCSRCDDSNFK